MKRNLRAMKHRWRQTVRRPGGIPVSIALLAVLACSRPPASTGLIDVVVQAQTSSAQLTRVSVVVTPGNVPGDLSPGGDGTFSGTLVVPVGPQTVSATAWSGNTQVGTGSASVTVSKGQKAQVAITVLDATGPAPLPDHSPVLTSLSVPVSTANVGDQALLSATAMDADGDPIAFSWSSSPAGCGSFSPPDSASTTWTAVAAGTCTVTATATAGGKSDGKSASIEVLAPVVLTVAFGGTGAGSVTVSPSGAAPSCTSPASCTNSYPSGTLVVLTAAASSSPPGSVFTGWTGCPSASGATCTIASLTAALTVTAGFALNPTLTVSISGGGSGTVTSTPGAIDCGAGGSACTGVFAFAQPLTLQAAPQTGSQIGSWTVGAGASIVSGCATGNASCVITPAAAAVSILVAFSLQLEQITVNVSGSGGTISSSPGPISGCGTGGAGVCTGNSFSYGQTVNLTATLAGGTQASWSVNGASVVSGCSGTASPANTSCQLQPTGTTTVSVTLSAVTTLALKYQTVTPAGTASFGLRTGNTSGVPLQGAPGVYWARGFQTTLKDNSGNGELFGFAFDSVSSNLWLYKSTDLGDHVTGDGQAGSGDPIQVSGFTMGEPTEMSICQTSDGAVHMIFGDYAGTRWIYQRLTLTHAAGAIIAAGVAAFFYLDPANFPGSRFASVNFAAGRIDQVFDQGGTERLAFLLTDDQGAVTSSVRHQFGVSTTAAGIAPDASTDFVGLDGAVGSSVVQAAAGGSPGVYTTNLTTGPSWGSNGGSHLYPGRFAQNPVSKDLWYFFGQVDGDNGNGDDGLGIQVARIQPSGPHTWALAPASVIVSSASVGADVQTPPAPKLISVYSTPNFVWALYSDPNNGLCIDRWDSSGNRAARFQVAYPGTNLYAAGAFAVSNDEQRIWIIAQIWLGFTLQFYGGIFFNGSTWVTIGPSQTPGSNDNAASLSWPDNWGWARSGGWNDGLLAQFIGGSGSNDVNLKFTYLRGGSQ
jgi:hypothetical protein